MADHVIPIEAPARTPRLGGIRTVVPEFQAASRLGLGGELEFVSYGCGFPVDDIVLCYPSGTQDEKTRTGVDTLNGIVSPFGLYAGVECYLEGLDYLELAREHLELGEDRGVEKRINDYFVSLTGVAATSFIDAVAKAEQKADDEYLGRPVLWMNRGDAVRARAVKAIESDKGTGNLYSANGTPIVASAKITANSVAVTGAVSVHATTIEVNQSPMVTVNRQLAIAERIYAVALDCEFATVYEIA